MERHLLFVVVLIFTPLGGAKLNCPPANVDVHITHAKTHLVLESDLSTFNPQERGIVVASLNHQDEQTWRFLPSKKTGFLNIVNQHNKSLALGLSRQYDRRNFVFNATLEVLNDDMVQQWFVGRDGTIFNAAGCNLVLRIGEDGKVVVAARTGGAGERFMLQYSLRNFMIRSPIKSG